MNMKQLFLDCQLYSVPSHLEGGVSLFCTGLLICSGLSLQIAGGWLAGWPAGQQACRPAGRPASRPAGWPADQPASRGLRPKKTYQQN